MNQSLAMTGTNIADYLKNGINGNCRPDREAHNPAVVDEAIRV